MKKCLVLLFVLMILMCSAAAADNMMVHVTAVSQDAAWIGEKWTAEYTLDGYPLYDGSVFDIAGGPVTITATLVENDSSPDVGHAEGSVNFTANRLMRGYSTYQEVLVTEDKGTHRGETVTWTVRYDFIPVEGYYYLN